MQKTSSFFVANSSIQLVVDLCFRHTEMYINDPAESYFADNAFGFNLKNRPKFQELFRKLSGDIISQY